MAAVAVWHLIVDIAEARATQVAELNFADFVEGQVAQLTGLLQAVSVEWPTGLTGNRMPFALKAVENIAVGLSAKENTGAVEYVIARVKTNVIFVSIIVSRPDAGIDIDFVIDVAVVAIPAFALLCL